MKPIGRRIVIEKIKKEEKVGNIYVPETGNDRSNKAVVVAISDPSLVTVRVGDTIMINKQAGMPIENNLFLIHEDEVIVIL